MPLKEHYFCSNNFGGLINEIDGEPGFCSGSVAFICGPGAVRFCLTAYNNVPPAYRYRLAENAGPHIGVVLRRLPHSLESTSLIYNTLFFPITEILKSCKERNRKTGEFTMIGSPIPLNHFSHFAEIHGATDYFLSTNDLKFDVIKGSVIKTRLNAFEPDVTPFMAVLPVPSCVEEELMDITVL